MHYASNEDKIYKVSVKSNLVYELCVLITYINFQIVSAGVVIEKVVTAKSP